MSDIRVRFAPSPTGLLHIGGARTALFNWLFARHEGGSFVLRIEDTDIERSSGELEEKLLEDIRWLGLDWDEGPYRQSERLDIYSEHAESLVEKGAAYPCFCTEEDLEAMRARARAAGEAPRYDGTCRSLSPGECRMKADAGVKPAIRFIVPGERDFEVDDLARGKVSFPARMVGDFVIMRSNGMPTYNFAASIDDALMGITHVIRGVEHLSNTVRQLLIYDTLGKKPPGFAHIPLILGQDRTKLSKRHGAPNIEDYRRRGYPAAAIVNYLVFLGWSTRSEDEILGVDRLVLEFDLSRVSDSPSVFDEDKLNWISANHIRRGGSKEYLEEAIDFIPAEIRERYGREDLERIFDIASEHLPCFENLPAETETFMPGPPEYGEEGVEAIKGAEELLAALREKFSALPEWTAESVRAAVKETGKETGARGKSLYMPVRAAVTGITHGPDLTSILVTRGRDDVDMSLAAALDAAGKRGGR